MIGRRNGEHALEVIILSAEIILTVFFALIVAIGGHPSELLLYLLFVFIAAIVLTYLLFSAARAKNRKAQEEYISGAVKDINQGLGYTPRRKGGGNELDATLAGLDAAYKRRQKQSRDILFITNAISSNTEISEMMKSILQCLLESTKSGWGAFYLANNASGKLELKASLGFDISLYQEFDITIGEGMLGAAARSDEVQVISNIPEDTVFATKTFLGKVVPRNIMMIPIINNGLLLGMLSLASFYSYGEEEREAADLYKRYVAIALVNCVAFERAERARSEIFFQNSLIQELNRELQLKVEDKSILLRNIINSIKDYAIYAFDVDGTVLEWNHGAEGLYGYTAAQAVGQNINMIYTDEEISTGRFQRRIDTVMQTGSYSDSGWKRKRDGAPFYAEINVFGLYNEKKQLIGMTSVTKDITPQKREQNELWYREELLKTLMESEDRAVVASGANGIIEYNDEYSKALLKKEYPVGLDLFYMFKESDALRRALVECPGSRLELVAVSAETNRECRLKIKILREEMLDFRKYIVVIY